jgi:hypothetical protein
MGYKSRKREEGQDEELRHIKKRRERKKQNWTKIVKEQ